MKPPRTTECPWCGMVCRDRGTLRLHVALNRCGRIPVDTVVPFDKAEAREADEVREWQPLVEATAKRFGWHCTHVRRAQVANGRFITPTSNPGFPDLWLLKPPELVVLELKRHGNRPKPKQVEYIARLQAVPGVKAAVVTPLDWPAVYRALSGASILTDVSDL